MKFGLWLFGLLLDSSFLGLMLDAALALLPSLLHSSSSALVRFITPFWVLFAALFSLIWCGTCSSLLFSSALLGLSLLIGLSSSCSFMVSCFCCLSPIYCSVGLLFHRNCLFCLIWSISQLLLDLAIGFRLPLLLLLLGPLLRHVFVS